MKKLVVYYSFIIVSVMVLTGFLKAQSFAQVVSAMLFFPLAVYFMPLVLPKSRKAPPLAVVFPLATDILTVAPKKRGDKKSLKPIVLKKRDFDVDRRMFLKLIGSAGLTVFFFSLFTKKAQAAFFGSVPGPGTVALKDSTGALIDPAIKTPTDAYKITEIDDGSPSYYGFVNKNGAWFIQREESSGAYRYTKGDSNFPTNWTNRASLTYNYFDAVF